MRLLFVLLMLSLTGFTACKKEGSGGNSKAPQITFISLDPNEFKSGSSDGKISISFEFRDPDADLGNANGTKENVYISQTLDTTLNNVSYLPAIPDDFKDPSKGLEGTASVIIPTSFFVLDSLHQQTGDTFHFELYIKDNAGNESNRIITPDVYIKP